MKHPSLMRPAESIIENTFPMLCHSIPLYRIVLYCIVLEQLDLMVGVVVSIRS
jgi:hypothetical protein